MQVRICVKICNNICSPPRILYANLDMRVNMCQKYAVPKILICSFSIFICNRGYACKYVIKYAVPSDFYMQFSICRAYVVNMHEYMQFSIYWRYAVEYAETYAGNMQIAPQIYVVHLCRQLCRQYAGEYANRTTDVIL